MSSAVTVRPSSWRSRFSSRIRSEKGSLARSYCCKAESAKYEIVAVPEVRVDFEKKESG